MTSFARSRPANSSRARSGLSGIVMLLIAAVPATAGAQETRAGTIAEQQAAKAADLKPYEPGGFERIASRFKRALVDTPNGFYPWLDSVYSGGGRSEERRVGKECRSRRSAGH